MILFAGDNGKGPVELLKQHDAKKFMGECEV